MTETRSTFTTNELSTPFDSQIKEALSHADPREDHELLAKAMHTQLRNLTNFFDLHDMPKLSEEINKKIFILFSKKVGAYLAERHKYSKMLTHVAFNSIPPSTIYTKFDELMNSSFQFAPLSHCVGITQQQILASKLDFTISKDESEKLIQDFMIYASCLYDYTTQDLTLFERLNKYKIKFIDINVINTDFSLFDYKDLHISIDYFVCFITHFKWRLDALKLSSTTLDEKTLVDIITPCLMLAGKLSDDFTTYVEDWINGLNCIPSVRANAQLSLKDLNILEVQHLNALNFDLYINSELGAKIWQFVLNYDLKKPLPLDIPIQVKTSVNFYLSEPQDPQLDQLKTDVNADKSHSLLQPKQLFLNFLSFFNPAINSMSTNTPFSTQNLKNSLSSDDDILIEEDISTDEFAAEFGSSSDDEILDLTKTYYGPRKR